VYRSARWRLLPGDVLVVEGNGSEDQIGRSAIFNGELEDCVHQNHIIRLRPDKNKLMPEYLNHYLNSPLGIETMKNISRTSSGLYHLSVGKIKSIRIPLPAIGQQAKAVAFLENLQKSVEQVQILETQIQSELDALLPAILNKAFKGEL
jgi:type I restriction enzyme S subunit